MSTEPKVLPAQTTFTTFTSSVAGLVPASGGGSTTYLRADGTFASITTGLTITNDTSTNSSWYPVFANASSGTMTTAYTSNTKLTFNPSTGELSATGHTAMSDQRLKYDVQPLKNSELVINSLEGKSFKFLGTNRKSIGLIAQEVELIIPEIVSANPDTGFKSVNYPILVAHLIEYVKVLDRRIKILEER